jgi:hypothetical protein
VTEGRGAHLAAGVTGAFLGPFLLFLCAGHPWLGAGATLALFAGAWLLPGARRAAPTLIGSAVAAAAGMVVLFAWWAASLGS